MRRMVSLVALCLTLGLVTTSVAKHPQAEHKSRVSEQDLSNEQHTIDGEHNPKYDQDALFGKAADDFRGLPGSAKESRLKSLFTQMDTNSDGFLSTDELHQWLKGNAMEQWSEYGLKPSDMLTWEFYQQKVTEPDGEYEDKDEESRQKFLERDKRRWDLADANHDGVLSFTESAAFFNAESHPEMQDVVVQETIEEMDHDLDGYISQKEYIDDLWVPSNPSEEEPDWIKDERKHFDDERDKDHDGKLDKEEVKAWIFPPGDDHVESEVSHLLNSCDKDGDGKLSEQELIGCHETLIGSAVTNYGELLAEHDEL
ncbi:calumenin [Clonorchis sinensis]|uniref:Reticulocalbin-3 n=1 Tax=Clonorchis sinensis TaxID=79923 RepID=H2KQ89_CLOSI|nr:calumenin [Clonorchis sinensis]